MTIGDGGFGARERDLLFPSGSRVRPDSYTRACLP
jgi:hypothetical protein